VNFGDKDAAGIVDRAFEVLAYAASGLPKRFWHSNDEKKLFLPKAFFGSPPVETTKNSVKKPQSKRPQDITWGL